MSTLLTIDLDFWMNDNIHGYDKKNIDRLIRDSRIANVKVVSVLFHHEILLKLKNKTFDKVINMDYHSDIGGFNINKETDLLKSFNEGTWVNFVQFRKNAEYTWLHLHNENTINSGLCDEENNPFEHNNTGWKKVSHDNRYPTDNELNDVTYVVICISPNWIYDGVKCKTLFKRFAKLGWISESICKRMSEFYKSEKNSLAISEKNVFKKLHL